MAHASPRPRSARRHRVRVALEGARGPRGRRCCAPRSSPGSRRPGSGRSPSSSARSPTVGRRRPRSARNADGGVFADELLELGDRTGAGGRRCVRRTGRAGPGRRPWSSAVIVRQKRWVAKWMDFSTEPLRLPRRGGQATTLDPVVLGHGHEARLDDAGLRVDDGRHAVDAPAPGVAAEPAQHAVHASIRCGWSSALGEDARNFPEHGSEPTSRWASSPQGASGSSSQSHWISYVASANMRRRRFGGHVLAARGRVQP